MLGGGRGIVAIIQGWTIAATGRNRLKTLPSIGDPAVAEGRQPPLPPADCPPGGHDRDAGVAADNKLARFARLLRSKNDPPLDVAAVDEDGN